MSRSLKPLERPEDPVSEIKEELKTDNEVRVITTEQLILNNQNYIISLLENLNVGLNRLAKQGGFDLTKD